MKIGYAGIAIPEGKHKYKDTRMQTLVEKCKPKKVTPYYVEFIKDDFVKTEAIAISKESLLDLLIPDMEKFEILITRIEDDTEKDFIKKCLDFLEQERPLCDFIFSEAEHELLRKFVLLSYKPVLTIDEKADIDEIIRQVFEKAGKTFFYTAGPREVHAWIIDAGSDILTCAGKIHTDLARGFIKGDIAAFDDFMQCHSFNDCKKKGLVKVVDGDYKVETGDIIEIRFNV